MSSGLAAALAFASERVPLLKDPGEASRLERTAEWLALHASVGHVDVRTFFSDTAEYARLAYSRRVRAGNEGVGGDAMEPWVRSLVSDINDYRAMMGRAADVKPGPAEGFDSDSARKSSTRRSSSGRALSSRCASHRSSAEGPWRTRRTPN